MGKLDSYENAILSKHITKENQSKCLLCRRHSLRMESVKNECTDCSKCGWNDDVDAKRRKSRGMRPREEDEKIFGMDKKGVYNEII